MSVASGWLWLLGPRVVCMLRLPFRRSSACCGCFTHCPRLLASASPFMWPSSSSGAYGCTQTRQLTCRYGATKRGLAQLAKSLQVGWQSPAALCMRVTD